MKKKLLSLNLEHLVKIHNLSINELAKKSGIPQPTLHRMLSGTTASPRRKSLAILAEFFNISVLQLEGLESLPLSIPNIIKNKHSISEIPIVPWELLKSWPSDIETKDLKKIIIDKEVPAFSFALICPHSQLAPLFNEGTILIFKPFMSPKNRSFCLVYFKENNQLEFNRLIVDDNDYYLKSEDISENVILKKIKKEDRIIGVLIESRTTF